MTNFNKFLNSVKDQLGLAGTVNKKELLQPTRLNVGLEEHGVHEGVSLFLHDNDDIVSECIRRFASWELIETAFVVETVRPDDVAIDLGANIGYYTCILGKIVGPNGNVYAFEPNDSNHYLLTRNVELNGLENVSVMKAIVADHAGIGVLREHNSTNAGRTSSPQPPDRRMGQERLQSASLTACRSGEIRMAHWNEFHCDEAEWTIPAKRMKAKREHRVPLTPRALEILHEAQALTDGSGLVFPGTRPGKTLSDMTLSKLVKELGFDADVHGFRTSFRTWAQEQTNFPREVPEAALAHVNKDKSEAAYARSDLFEKRRKLMNTWASYLAAESGTVLHWSRRP